MINLLLHLGTVYEEVGLPKVDASNSVESIKNLIFVIAGVVTMYIILSAGFKYVVSGGNPENTKKAGQTIIFGVLGLVIILLSYTIITWVFKVGGA